MEPQKKVLVSEEFLSTDHGEMECVDCHGGDPASSEKSGAHTGIDPLPSINNPQEACGECHEEIVETAVDSLHNTLAVFPKVLKSRADMDKWGHIDEARQNHCAACHTSCGGCHVSRPNLVKKGFVNGHVFQKRPDPLNQCTACHGSRVGNEFYGKRGRGDIHAAKAGMDCAVCHQAEEMHAAAPEDIQGRYGLEQAVACTDCHKDLRLGSVRDHAIHENKVQCQVCHSQTYVSCYNCHVGKDDEGLAFFQNQLEVETMKIGRNPDKTESRDGFKYVLLRHIPSYPEMFDFYGKGGFTNFGNTPTWKRASPHNIQRRNWQAASCNHCHGNRQLFLSDDDLRDYEREANRKVVVSDEDLPEARPQVAMIDIDVSNVRTGMVVDANWLHENLKKNLVVVDARMPPAYNKGHIEGAIQFDLATSGLRSPAEGEKPFTLVPHKDVVKILDGKGIAADDHIVVYDKDGIMAGALIAVLEWAGATHVSYLNGGIEGWHHSGFHMSTDAASVKAKEFKGTERPELIEDSIGVARLLEKRNTVLVDARFIDRVLGLSKHPLAGRAGAIPGSINLPLGTFYMDSGYLKPPEELLWTLKTYGITPEKTVITTCDTGVAASSAYFVLRYLGFPDVRIHDEAWTIWTRVR